MEHKTGLLGEHLGHSISPMIHNLITGSGYGLFERSEGEVGGFVRDCGLDGFNVTVPYKKTVMPFLDRLSEEARRVGAVNTVVNGNGVLTGYNTDVYGFKALLTKAGIDIYGKRAVILGTGGAAAAVKTALGDLGAAEILSVSRAGELNYTNIYGLKTADVIINATPVGMFPHDGGYPVDLTRFEYIGAAVDLIYNPLRTRFIDSAQRLGIKTADGLYMLASQAVRSCELFYNTEYPQGFTDRIYSDVLLRYGNIALIGMPGAGKNTVGRILADKIGRPLADTDEMITEKYGRTPEEIIITDGEEYFRRLESAVIAELSDKHGTVIVTGGGAVTIPRNIFAIRKNSAVVFIDRPPDKLDISGRPLSAKYGIDRLYADRLPLYKHCADFTVVNDASPEAAAEEIRAESIKRLFYYEASYH